MECNLEIRAAIDTLNKCIQRVFYYSPEESIAICLRPNESVRKALISFLLYLIGARMKDTPHNEIKDRGKEILLEKLCYYYYQNTSEEYYYKTPAAGYCFYQSSFQALLRMQGNLETKLEEISELHNFGDPEQSKLFFEEIFRFLNVDDWQTRTQSCNFNPDDEHVTEYKQRLQKVKEVYEQNKSDKNYMSKPTLSRDLWGSISSVGISIIPHSVAKGELSDDQIKLNFFQEVQLNEKRFFQLVKIFNKKTFREHEGHNPFVDAYRPFSLKELLEASEHDNNICYSLHHFYFTKWTTLPTMDGKESIKQAVECLVSSIIKDLTDLQFDSLTEAYDFFSWLNQDGISLPNEKIIEVETNQFPTNKSLASVFHRRIKTLKEDKAKVSPDDRQYFQSMMESLFEVSDLETDLFPSNKILCNVLLKRMESLQNNKENVPSEDRALFKKTMEALSKLECL